MFLVPAARRAGLPGLSCGGRALQAVAHAVPRGVVGERLERARGPRGVAAGVAQRLAERGLDLPAREHARAQERGRAAAAVDDGRLDAGVALAAVDDGHGIAELLEHVRGGGRADAAEAV